MSDLGGMLRCRPRNSADNHIRVPDRLHFVGIPNVNQTIKQTENKNWHDENFRLSVYV